MRLLLPIASVIAAAISANALADEDCRRPMTEWQSRDTVKARMAALGVTTERLRVDDGCYETAGRGADGNQIQLKIDPASLAILKLEVRFSPGADSSRYFTGARHQATEPTPKPSRDGASNRRNVATPITSH